MTKIWEPLKLDNIGNAVVVNGALLHEDMYRLDMLNRALADFCNANADYRVKHLMTWMYNDTLKQMLRPSTELNQLMMRRARYDSCHVAADPIAGFALLRSASMVNLLQELVRLYCGDREAGKAMHMVNGHRPDALQVVRKEGWPESVVVVDDLGAAHYEQMTLPRVEPLSEARSMWYAAECGLLPAAASLCADCFLLHSLFELMNKKLTKDGRWQALEEVRTRIATWQRNLLERQMQATLVMITGSAFSQRGISQDDAERLLKFEKTLTAVA